MAHLVDQEYLQKENINDYFRALAKEIKNAGLKKHRILVVGGAAMALKYHIFEALGVTVEEIE